MHVLVASVTDRVAIDAALRKILQGRDTDKSILDVVGTFPRINKRVEWTWHLSWSCNPAMVTVMAGPGMVWLPLMLSREPDEVVNVVTSSCATSLASSRLVRTYSSSALTSASLASADEAYLRRYINAAWVVPSASVIFVRPHSPLE
jgi:hypothetical protein